MVDGRLYSVLQAEYLAPRSSIACDWILKPPLFWHKRKPFVFRLTPIMILDGNTNDGIRYINVGVKEARECTFKGESVHSNVNGP